MLIRFISAEPQRELQKVLFLFYTLEHGGSEEKSALSKVPELAGHSTGDPCWNLSPTSLLRTPAGPPEPKKVVPWMGASLTSLITGTFILLLPVNENITTKDKRLCSKY